MRSKFVAAALAAIVVVSSISTPASAQQQNRPFWTTATVVSPFAAAAFVGSSATSLTWTSIATQQWFFPWTTLNPLSPNGIAAQTVHAGIKYVDVVIDPKYFNETWTTQVTSRTSGQHTISADHKVQQQRGGKSRSVQGKVIVGCIMGSAFGAITSAMRKATAMGNPPRWRSQAEHERIVASGVEKKYELTLDEASMSTAFCGIGSLALSWPQQP